MAFVSGEARTLHEARAIAGYKYPKRKGPSLETMFETMRRFGPKEDDGGVSNLRKKALLKLGAALDSQDARISTATATAVLRLVGAEKGASGGGPFSSNPADRAIYNAQARMRLVSLRLLLASLRYAQTRSKEETEAFISRLEANPLIAHNLSQPKPVRKKRRSEDEGDAYRSTSPFDTSPFSEMCEEDFIPIPSSDQPPTASHSSAPLPPTSQALVPFIPSGPFDPDPNDPRNFPDPDSDEAFEDAITGAISEASAVENEAYSRGKKIVDVEQLPDGTYRSPFDRR